MRELAWARLVETLSAAGRVRDALAAYQRARRTIVGELGTEPGPELAAAHRAALGTDGSVPAGVPHQLPRPVTLVDRGNELCSLVTGGDADPAPVLCLHGPAGIGKTALAVAAGHRLACSYPDGQLYVDLARRRGPADALGRLIRSVAGTDVRLPGDLDDRTALWRSVSYGRRLLVVLDNADNNTGNRAVELLAPGSVSALVLVTSRARLTGLAGLDVVTVPVPALTDDAVSELWRRRTGAVVPAAAREQVRRCAGNPGAVLALADRWPDGPGRLAALSQEGSWVA